MAWLFQQSFEPEYRKSIELTSETKPIFDADRQAFFKDVLDEKMVDPPGHACGFKYSKPETVYELNCGYKASEFHNFMISAAGVLIPQRVIDIIEDIEPGVHQYFSVKLLLKSGEPEPESYFSLNVCTLIEALDREASDVAVRHLPEERHHLYPWNKVTIGPSHAARVLEPPYQLFVRKEKVRGRALWCEYGMAGGAGVFYSEELVERVNQIGGMWSYEPWKRVGEI